jgi:hypothetical protein
MYMRRCKYTCLGLFVLAVSAIPFKPAVYMGSRKVPLAVLQSERLYAVSIGEELHTNPVHG